MDLRGLPYTPAELVLRDDSGEARARLVAVTAGDGRGSGQWIDAGGQPVASVPGDRILGAAGGDPVDILVEPLAFDYAPGTGIAVTASPGRSLALQLWRAADASGKGKGPELRLRTDDRGRYLLRQAPPRAGFRLDALTAIELSARVAPDVPASHRLVSVWPAPGEASQEHVRLALPWLAKRR